MQSNQRLFFRYVDDGFSAWPSDIDIDILRLILSSLHPSIKFTVEEGEIETSAEGTLTQKINFLDVTIILNSGGKVDTDVYYKETNNI